MSLSNSESGSLIMSKQSPLKTPISSSSQVNIEKEITDFYKLKAKYEEKISKIKQKIKIL